MLLSHTRGPPEEAGQHRRRIRADTCGRSIATLIQTCHERLPGKLVLSSDRPRVNGHSVILAPHTTRTQ